MTPDQFKKDSAQYRAWMKLVRDNPAGAIRAAAWMGRHPDASVIRRLRAMEWFRDGYADYIVVERFGGRYPKLLPKGADPVQYQVMVRPANRHSSAEVRFRHISKL